MSVSIAELRKNYSLAEFSPEQAAEHPLDQFSAWFNEAVQAQLLEPNAMTLATIDSEGMPDARIVLLKGIDKNGLVFFTNYQSAKGQQLESSPYACLVFWWAELERQARFRCKVEKISAAESEEYFHSRPRESQLGAWASKQSSVLHSREALQQAFSAYSEQFANGEIPLPDFWGGYRCVPFQAEFWQGRASRLHDRVGYKLESGVWVKERLSP